MILLGYSSFATIMIRSAANTPLDENDPQDVFALLSYLSREQYGDRPLLSGQWWDTPYKLNKERNDYVYEKSDPTWVKSFSVKRQGRSILEKSFKEKNLALQYIKEHPEMNLRLVEEYVDSGEKKKSKPEYDDEYTMLFPRMYSPSTSPNHVGQYKSWIDFYQGDLLRESERQAKDGMEQLQLAQRNYARNNNEKNERALMQAQNVNERAEKQKLNAHMPTQSENFRFFKDYQLDWMYFRYFMWNFAGRQNDAQGHGNVRDGNWLSGLDFIDQQRLGERSMITDEMKANKGWNRFYFLPLILGILGLVFQFVRDPKRRVSRRLFVFANRHRHCRLSQSNSFATKERDYAYAGSFYAFAVWIGLGVMALYEASRVQMTKSRFMALGIPLGIGLFLYVLESITGEAHAISMAVLFMSVVVALLFGLLWLVNRLTKSNTLKAVVSIGLVAGVPILMASEGWNDHDRSNRKTGSRWPGIIRVSGSKCHFVHEW